MGANQHNIAIVIPTIGRSAELGRMLESLAAQTRLPNEVIIVDEDESSRAFADRFPQLNIRVLVLPGSATAKRNAGIKALRRDVALVGFMDDDIVLEPAAVGAVAAFWEQAKSALGGTGCNYANAPGGFAPALKRLPIWAALGLYQPQPGGVARSGFQTRASGLQQTARVRWLPSGATFYSREVLEEFRFDEWFDSYSYLEDLDFSYRVGRKYQLAVVSAANFHHYPSQVGRPGAYLFGKKEVLNRFYFVSKHPELSRGLCCLALLIRTLMNLAFSVVRMHRGYLERFGGNLAGMGMILWARGGRTRHEPRTVHPKEPRPFQAA